jgi:hypothetical protein
MTDTLVPHREIRAAQGKKNDAQETTDSCAAEDSDQEEEQSVGLGTECPTSEDNVITCCSSSSSTKQSRGEATSHTSIQNPGGGRAHLEDKIFHQAASGNGKRKELIDTCSPEAKRFREEEQQDYADQQYDECVDGRPNDLSQEDVTSSSGSDAGSESTNNSSESGFVVPHNDFIVAIDNSYVFGSSFLAPAFFQHHRQFNMGDDAQRTMTTSRIAPNNFDFINGSLDTSPRDDNK